MHFEIRNQKPQKAFTLAKVFSTHSAGQRKAAFTLAEVFSTHFAGQRKSAFTLAEVLITLGIIGVVAAMTISVLTAKINRYIFNQQFKKAYSVIYNAFNSAAFDMDNNIDCSYPYPGSSIEREVSGCYSFFTEIFIKKLKIIKICDKQNAYENGCIPDYTWTTSSGCSFFNSNNIKRYSYAAVAGDGMIIFPYSHAGLKEAYPIIGFDINGEKGPNTPGVDVYALQIYKHDNNKYSFNNNLNICLPFTDNNAVKSLSEIMK